MFIELQPLTLKVYTAR